MDAERVLILVDGERIVGDFGGVVDLASLPLAGVERIEYVTGPTSSLYGTGALGGVINVISGRPHAEGWSGRSRLDGRSLPGVLTQNEAAYRQGALWTSAGLAVS